MLWERALIPLEGRYAGCVDLPAGYIMEEAYLEFTLTPGVNMSQDSGVALHAVSLHYYSCPGNALVTIYLQYTI